jgi:hypothetical protein
MVTVFPLDKLRLELIDSPAPVAPLSTVATVAPFTWILIAGVERADITDRCHAEEIE